VTGQDCAHRGEPRGEDRGRRSRAWRRIPAALDRGARGRSARSPALPAGRGGPPPRPTCSPLARRATRPVRSSGS
jgi:hypothetical protein